MRYVILVLMLSPTVARADDRTAEIGGGAAAAVAVAASALFGKRHAKRKHASAQRAKAEEAIRAAYPDMEGRHFEREVKNLIRRGVR